MVITVGIAAAVMLTILIFALLALLGGVGAVLTVLVALAALAGLIYAVLKYSPRKRNSPGNGGRDDGSPDQAPSDQKDSKRIICRKPVLKDVVITVLAYIVIPLAFVCVLAALSDEVRELLATGDFTLQQLMSAISGLLQCPGIGP